MNPLFIMGGIQAGAGLLGGLANKKAAKQAQEDYNRMARERNQAVLAETARNIGEINRQRTVLNMQTNQIFQEVLYLERRGVQEQIIT